MANTSLWQFRNNPTYPAKQATFRQVNSAAAAGLIATGDFMLADAHGPKYQPWDPLGAAPDPVLVSIAPLTAVNATPFTLTCTGSNFREDSVIRISGIAQTTVFVSPTELTCEYTGTAGNKTVVVRTPGQPDTGSKSLTIT
jgi:hypothetical protein